MESLADTLTIIHCALPKLEPGQALVRIRYFGINPDDVKLFSSGVSVNRLGAEFTGEVVKVAGESDRISIGDHVLGFLSTGGAFAQYVTCDFRLLVPIPSRLPLEIATCIPDLWVSSIHYLLHAAEFKKRERIAIIDAGNALGLVIVQLAQIMGVRRVHAVSKQPLSKERARSFQLTAALPDEVVVHYSTNGSNSFSSEIARYDPKGLEAVIDLSDAPGPYLRMLRPGGRLVWITGRPRGGGLTPIDTELMVLKNLQIRGSSIRSQNPLNFVTHLAYIQNHILPRFVNGRLTTEKPKVMSWKLAGSALRNSVHQSHGFHQKVLYKVD